MRNQPVVAFFLNGPLRGEYKLLPDATPEFHVPLPLATTALDASKEDDPLHTPRAVYRLRGSPRPRPGGWEQDYEFVGVLP